MTREEAIQFLDNMRGNESGRAIGADGFYAELCGYHVQALNMAIKALEHPEQNVIAVVPCGDCISRQAALDAFGLSEKTRKYGGDHSGYDTMMLYEIQQTLEHLPSVNPQPKTGHWKIKRASIHPYGNDVACSECGFTMGSSFGYKYCPQCGTKMVEPQKSEEQT